MQYNSWKIDAFDSVKAFYRIKDTILPKLLPGTIHIVEHQDNEILMLLDQKSGIDYISETNHGLQGIAWRAQWGRAWNTFTIRKIRYTGSETEFSKRIQQIDSSYLHPAYTMQGYFDNRIDNNLLSVALIKTDRLYQFINDHPDKSPTRESDNIFYYIDWDNLKYYGISVHYEKIVIEDDKLPF